jgi:hypothetical protein
MDISGERQKCLRYQHLSKTSASVEGDSLQMEEYLATQVDIPVRSTCTVFNKVNGHLFKPQNIHGH